LPGGDYCNARRSQWTAADRRAGTQLVNAWSRRACQKTTQSQSTGHGIVLIARKQLARKTSLRMENEFCLTIMRTLIYQHCGCKRLGTLLCAENN
jgi:hypothetical protein